MSTATIKTPGSGIIRPDVVYTLETASKLLGFGRHAMRQARRAGLKVRYAHGRAFLMGRDIVEYLERCGETEHG